MIHRICEGAANNLPDAAAERTAKEILAVARRATADDLVIVLISGGGSALLTCPVEGVTLQEKRQVSLQHVWFTFFGEYLQWYQT